MKIRCKFWLGEVLETPYGKTFTFTPQYDPAIPEDQVFQKMSPTGKFTIFVTNPVVLAEWKVGEYYYFDTTPVTEEAAATSAA
jgi:hypothetical protein